MSIRYFNLKKENPQVNGSFISVDMDKDDLERFAHVTEGYCNGLEYRFEVQLEPTKNDLGSLLLTMPITKFQGASRLMGVSSPGGWYKDGEDKVLLDLSSDGNLQLSNDSSVNTATYFLSEVDEETTLRNKANFDSYRGLQDYILS